MDDWPVLIRIRLNWRLNFSSDLESVLRWEVQNSAVHGAPLRYNRLGGERAVESPFAGLANVLSDKRSKWCWRDKRVLDKVHSRSGGGSRRMNKYLVKHGATDLEKAAEKDVRAMEPRSGFSFRYAYREVSLSGGTTRIRSREHRFKDGKFESEEFDGTMDGAVYHDAVKMTQDLLKSQVNSFIKLLAVFSPFSRSK